MISIEKNLVNNKKGWNVNSSTKFTLEKNDLAFSVLTVIVAMLKLSSDSCGI